MKRNVTLLSDRSRQAANRNTTLFKQRQFRMASAIAVFAGCLLIPAAPQSAFAQTGQAANEPAHPQRDIGDIRRDMEAFIRNSKQEEDFNLQVGSVVDLCYLHHEIVTDPRFGSNSRLKSFRAMTADRLQRYSRYVDVQMRRHEREEQRLEAEERRRRREQGEGADDSSEEDEGSDTPSEFDEPSDSGSAINDAMNDSMFTMGSATGGPVNVFGYLGGNFAPPWDHGFELQDLIERTINPEFWKTNGGDGVVHYYRPSRVLVVSASWEMHDRLETFLEMLR
ncbi:MAG: hypothetical protein AAF456_07290 [Planctomycetota bacterium]